MKIDLGSLTKWADAPPPRGVPLLVCWGIGNWDVDEYVGPVAGEATLHDFLRREKFCIAPSHWLELPEVTAR